MKEIFESTSYSAALSAAVDRLAARTVDLRRRHILIVPDRCTLTAERLICDRLGGAFDAEVTTWSRLLPPSEAAGHLPRQGSVMMVRGILEEKKRELSCYKKSASARGFAAKLYESISQLAVCEVTPEEVLAVGGEKARDIALVYGEYLARTRGMYCDAAGRMRLLRDWLENSDFLRGATVYVACFDSYTKQMENILAVMERKADGLYVFECKPEYSFGDTELYAASSPVFAAKAVARRIACDARDGVPYDDICVVTAGRPDEICRILGENGIPYSATETLRLSDHPLGRFLSLALSLGRRGYRPADVVRLTKNPLSGAAKADSDALERYAAARGITYKLFLSPFLPREGAKETEGEAALRESAERARAVVARIVSLPGGSEAERIAALIDYAENNYTDALAAADDGRANPFEKARALLSLCSSLLPGADDRVVADSFAEGMAAAELAARPARSGVVEIGGERDFRARTFSRVYVLDFDGDAHPAVTQDGGLISDDDIELLRSRGSALSPTTADVNRRARDEFFLLLAGAEKIMLVHTDKPGSVLGAIKARARSFSEGGTGDDMIELASAADTASFLRCCPTLNMAVEEYLAARPFLSSGTPKFYPYAAALAAGTDERRLPPYPSSVPEAGRLMDADTTMVSRLETYFSCPMKHFLSYGLRLRLPETGELRPLDVGSILHAVAEGYVPLMDEMPPEEAARMLLEKELAASGKADLEVNRSLAALLEGEAEGLCRAVLAQIKTGSFRPAATEAEFGFEGSRLPAPELEVGGRRITVRGKIDRVDVAGDMARVVDYKTGGVKFDLKDLRCGVKLQLLVYLAVLVKAGYRPAGAFYFPTLSEFGDEEPFMMEGLCANGEDVLAATDPGISDVGSSAIVHVKKRGKKTYVGWDSDENDLRMLADYALRAAAGAAGEIADGYIAPSPYGPVDACARCDYAAVCGYEGAKREPAGAALKKDGEEQAK